MQTKSCCLKEQHSWLFHIVSANPTKMCIDSKKLATSLSSSNWVVANFMLIFKVWKCAIQHLEHLLMFSLRTHMLWWSCLIPQFRQPQHRSIFVMQENTLKNLRRFQVMDNMPWKEDRERWWRGKLEWCQSEKECSATYLLCCTERNIFSSPFDIVTIIIIVITTIVLWYHYKMLNINNCSDRCIWSRCWPSLPSHWKEFARRSLPRRRSNSCERDATCIKFAKRMPLLIAPCYRLG